MRPEIWAIGGGKGGVGKSLFTANLGAAVAKRGHRCVLLDADLGGANLHTILGAASPRFTLSDFLRRNVASLEEVVTPTPTPGLALVSGARALIEAPNLKYFQKQRLIRQLSSLGFDYVLLDLSAGAAFNTLDFFLAANRGILVVVPEPTSIENAYHFLRAAFHRRLRRISKELGVEEVVEQARQLRTLGRIGFPKQLLETVGEIDRTAADRLRSEVDAFEPQLIVNQVRGYEEAALGREIAIACRDYFGIEVAFLGAIPFDDAVRKALRCHRPSIDMYPHGGFATAVRQIAETLLEAGRAPRLETSDLTEDYRTLRIAPGCRLIDVLGAHKRMKELYSRASLATDSLIDEDQRRALLAGIDRACKRIVEGYSLPTRAEMKSAGG